MPKRVNKKKKENKFLENILTAVMLFSGMALVLSLSGKPRIVEIGAMGQQLAPPIPSNWIFIFFALFAGSMIYFVIRSIERQKRRIPLGFE